MGYRPVEFDTPGAFQVTCLLVRIQPWPPSCAEKWLKLILLPHLRALLFYRYNKFNEPQIDPGPN